jgi:hypothetical protein
MKRKLMIAGIVIGSILALGPVWGMIAVFFGMQHAFDVLGASGISDPRELSSSIGLVLFFQIFSFLMCPVGIALIIFCVIKLQAMRRQPPPLSPLPPP